MNRDLQLKIQALVDGELTGRKAREVQRLLANDAQAEALVKELTMTKQALAGNELELPLPESREFYWNKIERELQRPECRQEHRGWQILHAWRKFLAPIAGMALVVLLAVGILKNPGSNGLAEVQNLSEHTGSFSFRSSDNMFVVWVYEKPQSSEQRDWLDEDDVIVQ